MKFNHHDFRHASEILSHRAEWLELKDKIASIEMSDVLAAQEYEASRRKKAPAGAQTAVNRVFDDALTSVDWTPQPRLFAESQEGEDLRRWKMDFIKSKIGVEVSFNHAEAIAWTFVRLNLAGESTLIKTESIVDVGVAIFATKEFKRWGRMDSAVGTFEQAKSWLEMMKPVLPIPILLLGLDPGWPDVQVFRGTSSN